MKRKLSESELVAYLAGFVDGEGCIRVGMNRKKDGTPFYYVCMSVHQVNPQPLEMLKNRYGGSIHRTERRGNQRPLYEWISSSLIAVTALRELRPYLVVKADEADLALEFQDRLVTPRRYRHLKLSKDELQLRHEMYLAMRGLKKRDYSILVN